MIKPRIKKIESCKENAYAKKLKRRIHYERMAFECCSLAQKIKRFRKNYDVMIKTNKVFRYVD